MNEDGVARGETKWRLTDTKEYADNFKVELLCMPLEEGDEGDDEEGEGNGEGEESESNDE